MSDSINCFNCGSYNFKESNGGKYCLDCGKTYEWIIKDEEMVLRETSKQE